MTREVLEIPRETLEIEMDDLELDETSLKSRLIEQLKLMNFSNGPFFQNNLLIKYMMVLEETAKTEAQLLFQIYGELIDFNQELPRPLANAFVNAISQFLNCSNNLNSITQSLLQLEGISDDEVNEARIAVWKPLVESGAAAHGGFSTDIIYTRSDQKLAIESQEKYKANTDHGAGVGIYKP